MSYGTSDTTVISSTKTEAHNLITINASAATRDDFIASNLSHYYFSSKPSVPPFLIHNEVHSFYHHFLCCHFFRKRKEKHAEGNADLGKVDII